MQPCLRWRSPRCCSPSVRCRAPLLTPAVPLLRPHHSITLIEAVVDDQQLYVASMIVVEGAAVGDAGEAVAATGHTTLRHIVRRRPALTPLVMMLMMMPVTMPCS